jgi:hypothetical protein
VQGTGGVFPLDGHIPPGPVVMVTVVVNTN